MKKWFFRGEKNEKDPGFLPLYPIESSESSPAVEALLDCIYENDSENIKNIAISGGYGSGKSSIIKTLELKIRKRWHPVKSLRYDPIIISSIDLFDKSKDIDKNSIEIKIAQQIASQTPNWKIPFSRFKSKTTTLHYLSLLALLLAVILLGGYILYEATDNYSPATHNLMGLLVSLLFTTLTTCFLFLSTPIIHSALSSIKITLKIKDLFELNSNSSLSFLEKNLDEILYLIRNSGKRLFVFEDIDRLKDNSRDSLSIFDNLREINLAYSKKYPHDRLIFVYLISDDIFNNPNDKTKFFDLIIPAVPIFSPLKAKTILKEQLGSEKIDELTFRKLGHFVHDNRTLNSIINEYRIYSKTLTNHLKESEEKGKLLTMLFYKNLFPEDFLSLYKNQGFLYHIINDFIPEKREEKTEKLKEERNREIKSITDEPFSSKGELIDYLLQFEEDYIIIASENGKKIAKQDNIEDKEVFIKYILDNNITNKLKTFKSEYDADYRFNWGKNYSEILTIEEFKNFKSRLDIINKKPNLDKIKSEYSEKIKNIDISTSSLGLDIRSINGEISKKFEHKNIPENLCDFLSTILNADLLDHDYQEYLSPIDDISKINDDKFIELVDKRATPNYTLKLNNPSYVFNNIKDSVSKCGSAANFDFFNYIQENQPYYKKYFFEDDKGGFIFEYINHMIENQEKNINEFKDLVADWYKQNPHLMITEIQTTQNIDYLLTLLLSVDIENNPSAIKSLDDIFGSNTIEIPNGVNLDLNDIFLSNIAKFNFGLKNISSIKETKGHTLARFIYENNRYELNDQNIAYITTHFGYLENLANYIIDSNYTSNIQQEHISAILKSILDSEMLISFIEIQKDSIQQSDLVAVFENESISIEVKIDLFSSIKDKFHPDKNRDFQKIIGALHPKYLNILTAINNKKHPANDTEDVILQEILSLDFIKTKINAERKDGKIGLRSINNKIDF